MTLSIGSVTVANDGNATGTGLAKAIYDQQVPVAPVSQPKEVAVQGNRSVADFSTKLATSLANYNNANLDDYKVVSTTTTILAVINNVVDVDVLVGAINVQLPTSPTTGQWIRVKAAPNAAAFNVTVQGNGHNIDGAASEVLAVNNAARLYIYNGSQWRTWT